MRRLEALDRLLLAILLPAWCVAVTLHVREVVRTGLVQVPIFAVPDLDSEGYPRVGGFRLERDSSGTHLEIDDRLIRVGDTDLRGAGYFGLDAATFDQAGESLKTRLLFERAGQRQETDLALRPSATPWARLPFSLSFALIAVLVLLSAPPSRATRYFFVGFLCFSLFETPFEGGPPAQTYAAYAIFYGFGPVAMFCLIRWVVLFPEELAPEHRLSAHWSWVGAVFLLSRANYVFGGPVPTAWIPQVVILSDLVFMVVCIGILTHNTLEADPVGRRRVKWVLYGGYLASLPLFASFASPFVGFDFARYDELMNFSQIMSWLFPAGILVGVLRYGLFDIDRLISTTATASVLTALLVAAFATVVPAIGSLLGSVFGVAPETGQTMVSAALAAGAVPTHQWLRPQVDRLFFVERHGLEHGVAELLPAMSEAPDATSLVECVGHELLRLLQPEVCAIYARDEASYAPVFAAGRAVPPAFEAAGPLIGSLENRAAPLALPRRSGRKGDATLGPFERAALETLGAEVVAPIRRGSTLLAFLCLGAKKSGDVYTPTDLSLLTAVAEKTSAELLRFDQEQVIREGEAMQASLRRYVPGAVADELIAGTELDSRERPVSVLFVDIRGYTSFSQAREASEVFSTINRYTASVSETVRRHGGSVVEFNGDGMMVIFGAPKELAHKERAAVEAGLEIVESIGTLDSEGAALAVGVGIASGDAFVGNIQAADRMIWSAIGD